MEKNTILPKLSSISLPWPTDWAEIFGVERPLILDIGFGYGHTLVHLHKTKPDYNIVGVEIDNTCLIKAEKAIPRKSMDNVRVVRTRAETALNHLFTPESLHEVHVNFPDPWFKTKHSGRRLMQRDTLNVIVSRLAPGGMFYLATDIIAYAEMSAEILAETPGLTPQHGLPWASHWPGRIVTKYEKRARKQGRDCYYFAYQRNDTAIEPLPVIEEKPMPYMIIQTPLTSDEMMEQFSPGKTYAATNELRVKFLNCYRNDYALLYEVYIHEPTIEQHLTVMVIKRDEPNQYALKIGGIGNPRSTEGLHFAVGTLSKLLLELHPESSVVENKINSKYR